MAAAQSDPGQQRRVYEELWTSFVALIRSYVAANDLARPVSKHAIVEEGENGRLTVRAGHKTLALEFAATTGAGSWAVYEDDLSPERGPDRVLERGEFRIDEESQVGLSGRPGKVALDVAAEIFTAKVF